MQQRYLKDTGRTSDAGEMCEPGPSQIQPPLTSSAVAIPAKRTAEQMPLTDQKQRVSAVSSSGLLMYCARALFSARIRPAEKMLLGHGNGSARTLSRLVTLCSPSDSDPAALALSADGNGCSCSPSWGSPLATDWKGGARTERTDGGTRMSEFRHQYTHRTGFSYPDPAVTEALLMFPAGWTDLDA